MSDLLLREAHVATTFRLLSTMTLAVWQQQPCEKNMRDIFCEVVLCVDEGGGFVVTSCRISSRNANNRIYTSVYKDCIQFRIV